jgi:leucyl-tRNA synthetase
VRLLSPLTPHLAEELGEGEGPALVAASNFPEAGEFAHDSTAEATEQYLDRVEEDLRPLLRMAQERETPNTGVVFFVAAPWKREVEGWAREALRERPKEPPIGAVMARAAQHPEVSAHRAAVAQYVGRIAGALRTEGSEPHVVDELHVLRAAEAYLVRRLGFQEVLVVPEDEGEAHDPAGRRDRARPGKPAFYLYAGRAGRSTGAASRQS